MKEILNNFRLEQLPYVEFLKKERLPQTAGIYFAVDNEYKIWYIGKAQNLRARWIGHHRYDQLRKINQKIPLKLLWLSCNRDETTLTELEKYFIDGYHPFLNQTNIEARKIIPAEIELRNTLVKIAKYVIVYGHEINSQVFGLPTVYLKYDSLYKNPASIFRRIFNAANKRGGLKWSYYWKNKKAPIWKTKCNGICVVVAPWSDINCYMPRAEDCNLAGIRLLNISKNDFNEEASKNNRHKDTYHPRLERYSKDPISLLWSKDLEITQNSAETLKDLSKQRTQIRESKIGTYRPRGSKVRVICTSIGWGAECIVETYQEAIEWFGGYEALGLKKTDERPYSFKGIRGWKPHKVTVRIPEVENGIKKYRSLSAPISASTYEELMQRFEKIKQLSPWHKKAKLKC